MKLLTKFEDRHRRQKRRLRRPPDGGGGPWELLALAGRQFPKFNCADPPKGRRIFFANFIYEGRVSMKDKKSLDQLLQNLNLAITNERVLLDVRVKERVLCAVPNLACLREGKLTISLDAEEHLTSLNPEDRCPSCY